MNDARYTRQVRLADVGQAGQERLRGAVVRVGSSAASEVEARYLRGAGLAVEPGDVRDETAPTWLKALVPGAREVGEGAFAALNVMKSVLAAEPHPRVSRITRA